MFSMMSGISNDGNTFFPSSSLISLLRATDSQSNVLSFKTSVTNTTNNSPSKNETANNKLNSSVILFTEVYAFKLVDEKYVNQGKCALGLIRNSLLLYKEKEVNSVTKVCNQLQFEIQKNICASYCDDQKQNWTVQFNSDLHLNEYSSMLEARGAIIKTNHIETNVSSKLSEKTIDKDFPKQMYSVNQSTKSTINVQVNLLSQMEKFLEKVRKIDKYSDNGVNEANIKLKEQNSILKLKIKKLETNIETYKDTDHNRSKELAEVESKIRNENEELKKENDNLYLIIKEFENNNGTVEIIKAFVEKEQRLSIENEELKKEKENLYLILKKIEKDIEIDRNLRKEIKEKEQKLRTENDELKKEVNEVRTYITKVTIKMEDILEKIPNITKCSEQGDNEDSIRLKQETKKLKSIIKKMVYDIETDEDTHHNQEWKLCMENEELKTEIGTHIFKEYRRKVEELGCQVKEFEEKATSSTEADGDK